MLSSKPQAQITNQTLSYIPSLTGMNKELKCITWK